jgi:hypothetical protein
MGFLLHRVDIEAIINCTPEAIEKFLRLLRNQIERFDSE